MKVIDMHCDTISGLFALKEQGKPEGLRQNNCHIDLLRMKQSRYLIQNFALFVPLKRVSDPWEQVCSLYRLYQEELERNRDILAPVLCFSDIQKKAVISAHCGRGRCVQRRAGEAQEIVSDGRPYDDSHLEFR